MSAPAKVRIRRMPDWNDQHDWQVWIPPTRPEHYEGDAILAPWGDTYWPSWREAVDFAVRVLCGAS